MKKITEYFDSPIRFEKQPFLRGIGEEYLENEIFNKWFYYLLSDYKVPSGKEIALFIVCSWGKPYNQSYIHYIIQKKIFELGKTNFDKIHQIVVSNCGLVPKEFENLYPFCAYDWDPTLEWDEIKEKYSNVLFERLNKFLDKHQSKYKEFCCFLRSDSDSYNSIKKIENVRKINIPNLISEINIDSSELNELSLNGLYDDPDIVLISSKNLMFLKNGLEIIMKK